MSINKPLSFSNVNCLGNALTYNKPCSFSARIENNAAVKLATTDYIYFGSQDKATDISRIRFTFSPFSTSNVNVNFNSFSSGKWDICSNLISNGEYRIKRATVVFAGSGAANVEIVVNNHSYTASFTRASGYRLPARLELSSTGVPTLSINGEIPLTLSTTETTETNDNIAYFNSHKIDDTTGHIANGMGMLMRDDLSCYNSSGTLTHMYRMSEDSGNILYDSVGLLDGVLNVASLAAARTIDATIQYPYNAIYGFKQDVDPSVAASTAKIPLTRDLIIYKSDFTSDATNWTNATKVENEDAISIKSNYAQAQATIDTIRNNIGIRTNMTQVGRSFKLNLSIKNLIEDIDILSIRCLVGSNTNPSGISESAEYFFNAEEKASRDIIPIELVLPSHTPTTNPIIAGFTLWVVYSSVIEPTTVCYQLSDVTFTQTNYTKDYPKVENGLNNCESHLDFTRTISNVAELYQVPNASNVTYIEQYINPYTNMYSTEGWNITSAPSSAITDSGEWRVGTLVSYLVSQSDTPEKTDDPTNYINIKTNTYLSNANSGQIFYSTIGNLGNLSYKRLKCKYSLKYKINNVSSSDTGRLDIGMGYTSFVTIQNKDITDTNWHEVSGESYFYINQIISVASTQMTFGISWNTSNSSSTYAGSIADCNFTVEPEELTLNPIAFNIDHDAKSISNVLVYKKEFDPVNTKVKMDRIKNHVKHFN